MKIYRDLFLPNNDEILSDAYPVEAFYNDVVIEVKSTRVTAGGGEVDIGRGNAFGGGDEDEVIDPNVETVIDLVDIFSYVEVPFTKKEFVSNLKKYVGRLKKWLQDNSPGRVEAFTEGANAFAQAVVGRFDEYQFWVPSSSLDSPSMIILSYYKEGETAPTFVYFKDGFIEQKV